MSIPTESFGSSAWFDNVVIVGKTEDVEDLGRLEAEDTFSETFYITNSLFNLGTPSSALVVLSSDRSLSMEGSIGSYLATSIHPGAEVAVTFEQVAFGPAVNDDFSLRVIYALGNVELVESSSSYTSDRRPLFSHEPQTPIVETISFATNVQEAWDGTEQRTRIRPLPRSKYSCEYLFADGEDAKRLKIRLAGFLGHYVNIPLWHLVREVTEVQTVIASDPATFRIIFGDPLFERPEMETVYLLNTVTGVGELVEVYIAATDENDSFQVLAADTTFTPGDTNLIAMPIARVYMKDNPSYYTFPTGAVKAKVDWVSDSSFGASKLNTGIEYSSRYPGTHISFPVIDDRHLVGSEGLEISNMMDYRQHDEKVGIITLSNRLDVPKPTLSKNYDISNDLVGLNDLRKFFLWSWGKQRAFYVPSQTNDVQVHSSYPGGPTGLRIELDGYGYELLAGSGYAGGSQAESQINRGGSYYGKLEIEDDQGTVYRSGSNMEVVEINSNFVQFAQPTGPEFNFLPAAASIVRVSFLPLMRLGSDEISLTHTSRGSATCTVDMVAVEQ